MRYGSDPVTGIRRHFRLSALIGLALAAGAPVALGADLYVICRPGVALQPAEIRDAFIGDKGFAGAVKLAPADNEAAQAEFLQKIIKLDAARYAAMWTKKSFLTGANPPPAQGTDAEAIAYVKHTAGGCSYVTAPPGDGVTVIAKF